MNVEPFIPALGGKNGHNGHNGHAVEPPLPVVSNATSRYVDNKLRKRVEKAMARAIERDDDRTLAPAAEHVRLGSASHRTAGYLVPAELVREPPDGASPEQEVVRPLPRPQRARAESHVAAQQPQWELPSTPRVSALQMLRRLGVYIGALLYFVLGNLWDRMRGRDSIARRAVRLRQTFERVGGTFVKVGQQMASRVDLLPVEYCEELALMLDRFPPIPTEQALKIIERAGGNKIEEIFSAFDPHPIGSASIACVYQAVLKATGEKVAIKVRRPGIEELFETDFRVLDLLAGIAETLTLVPPGVGAGIREEIRNTLSSELDFRREARIQEIYARQARRAKLRFFSAPRIIPHLCNGEVIVQEFVSGMWMLEVLAGVEQRDPVALARMEELSIDPKKVARRLLFMNYWSVFEGVAFHADPHPANIVVRPNSEIVFVDFGACGYFDQPRRELYMKVVEAYGKGHVYDMARMGLALAEPLPPMDINAVTKDIERNYFNQLLAIKSKHAPWYERTSANTWIGTLRILSKHKVNSPPGDLLMYARSTLLYDTLAARLNPKINFYKEAQRYFKWSRRRSRKAGRRAMRRLFTNKLTDNINFEQINRSVDTFNSLLFRLRRILNVPYDFTVVPFMVEKWVHLATALIRLPLQIVLVTGLGAGAVAAAEVLQGQGVNLPGAFTQVIGSPLYLIIVALLVLVNLRLILFRLEHKTHKA